MAMVEYKNSRLSLSFFNSPEVLFVVTCAPQQTTARNPFAIRESESELNLTVKLLVLVKGPGMEVPRFS